MNPPDCELFRALLRRALGGRSVVAFLVLVAAAGAAAGWLAARCQAAGLGDRPSAGLLAWLIVRFPHTAMYALGTFAALQLAADYGADARTGWTVQYLAAGGTSDRYILALAGAGTCAGALLYLLAVSAWLAVATALGRPVSQLPPSTAFLLIALLWPASTTAFAAAAVAVAGRAGRAVALMIFVVLLPWLLLAAIRPDPEAGVPAWLTWLSAVSPPYPLALTIGSACLLVVYPGLLLGLAWVAAPHRLLRV